MDQHYAIITFRNTGPIKTWADMRGANVHNARTKPIEHAIPGAPAPEHLVGSNDLVADVKRHLRAADIDPAHLRKNGVIAYEAIMSASPGFFDAGDAAAREARLRAWTDAQVEFARKRWGDHRVASMVLHVDEKTPHIHLVVLPLEMKLDGRRADGVARHALVGRTISGPGMFDQLQDDYSAAMTSFGLVRGEKGSGRKHEPVPVYLARLAAKEQEADELRVALIRDRDRLAAERAALERDRADVARSQRLINKAAVEIQRKSATAWAAKVEVERAERDQARARSAWMKECDAAEAALAARETTFIEFRDGMIATHEKLMPIVEAADRFVHAARGRRPEDIVAAARPAVSAATEVAAVYRSSSVAAHLMRPTPQHIPSSLGR